MSASCNCGASGNPCTKSCANVVFTDNFTSALGGYTTGTCPGGSCTGNSFAVGGGLLTETFGGAPFTGSCGYMSRSIAIPTLSTMCMSICFTYKALSGKTGGQTGVFFGNPCGAAGGSPFFGNAQLFANLNLSPAKYTLSSINVGSSFNNGNVNDGDIVELVYKNVSTNFYSLDAYLNGTTVPGWHMTFSDSNLVAGQNLTMGLFCQLGGAWGSFSIATS